MSVTSSVTAHQYLHCMPRPPSQHISTYTACIVAEAVLTSILAQLLDTNWGKDGVTGKNEVNTSCCDIYLRKDTETGEGS
jgi:hypothetical protein